MNHAFADIIGGSRWLMEPRAFRAMVKRAESATPEAIQAAIQAYGGDRPPSLNMLGDVAVINMCGPITYKRSWFSMFFGGATIEDMQTQFRMALRDDAVRSIAFRVDSPGGEVTMVPEFADELFAARGQKPVIAIADTMICSAALWATAQMDATYVSASSCMGSVGCYLEHESIAGMLEKLGVEVTLIAYGKHKTDGNNYEPLSDEVKASLLQDVTDVGLEFDGAMARGRGVSRKVVTDSFGQGKVFRGKKIITAGLADKMGTFAQVIGKLTKGRMMALGGVAIQATADELDRLNQSTLHPIGDEVPVTLAAGAVLVEQDGGCQTCGEACPCDQEDTCPAECPDCDPACPCCKPIEAAKASADPKSRASLDAQQAEAQAQADADLLATTMALVR